MIGVIFCQKCETPQVDVRGWINTTQVLIACCKCGHTAHVDGFSIGRVWFDSKSEESAFTKEAKEDLARLSAEHPLRTTVSHCDIATGAYAFDYIQRLQKDVAITESWKRTYEREKNSWWFHFSHDDSLIVVTIYDDRRVVISFNKNGFSFVNAENNTFEQNVLFVRNRLVRVAA